MKKILAVMLTAAIVLTACCSCDSHEDTETEASGPVRHGNYITFGHYEQDEGESNGPEPVDWIIRGRRQDACYKPVYSRLAALQYGND